MRKCALAFAIILMSLMESFAQLNESDTMKFQLRSSLNGVYQKGNVDVLIIKSKLDFSCQLEKNWVLKSQNNSLYQAFYGKKVDNDVFSRNYLYYKPQNILYPFGIAYLSKNFRRKLDLRYFAGGGLTYQFIDTDKNVFKLSASVVYEANSFNNTTFNYETYNGNDQINLWRSTLYLSGLHHLSGRRIRLYYDGYWQAAFNNSNNYRLQADIGTDFSIWKGLSFNILYTVTHENVTIINIQQKDKILTFGLSYNFKK